MPLDFVGVPEMPSDLMKLDAAIGLIDTPSKWCKGALRSDDGRYCIKGAVRAVGGTDELEPIILQAIGEVKRKRYKRIESFNDHPNTTHDEVMAVMTRAREIVVSQIPRGPMIDSPESSATFASMVDGLKRMRPRVLAGLIGAVNLALAAGATLYKIGGLT